MKKVYQTLFGGQNAPVGERGNCWQAAIASILELPLENVPNIQEYDEALKWFENFREWLHRYGLSMMCFEVNGSNISTQGYHLIECESTTLIGEHHILVGLNGKVVYDPNPNAISIGKQIYHFVFTKLNPSQ